MLNLLLDNLVDDRVRYNFQTILEYIRRVPILRGEFKHFELTFTKAETNKRIPHNLGFLPLDVIQTRLTGSGAITWNYSLFTDTFLDVTTTNACVVRAFIGRYGDTGA